VDGDGSIDDVPGLGPISPGYAYPPVDRAIQEQLGKGILYGLLSPLAVELAATLAEVALCAEMTRFLESGAEVTSAAARIASADTGRELLLSEGDHGRHDTWTALAGAWRRGWGQGRQIPSLSGRALCRSQRPGAEEPRWKSAARVGGQGGTSAVFAHISNVALPVSTLEKKAAATGLPGARGRAGAV
jgi:hypothetical protein